MDTIYAPWGPDLVARLNAYQQSGEFHPYTCGGKRKDANHLDGEGILVATPDGWVCPYCGYRQSWCCSFHRALSPDSSPTDERGYEPPIVRSGCDVT